ncbi:hypothetical protein [Allomesorhizobium alhagi]|uniref:hypothetical protein n=1 Tax=Allomesorhizobium alhagi TaxID=475067 RepID=UPI0011121BD5|nr:hypothetical protein [Mesorhizobium alhagi]
MKVEFRAWARVINSFNAAVSAVDRFDYHRVRQINTCCVFGPNITEAQCKACRNQDHQSNKYVSFLTTLNLAGIDAAIYHTRYCNRNYENYQCHSDTEHQDFLKVGEPLLMLGPKAHCVKLRSVDFALFPQSPSKF